MTYLAAVVILGLLVALVVSVPLRPGQRTEAIEGGERAELEAAREAKYRELHDHELDFRTGKIAEAEYEAGDRELRREALDILDRLEAVEAAEGKHR